MSTNQPNNRPDQYCIIHDSATVSFLYSASVSPLKKHVHVPVFFSAKTPVTWWRLNIQSWLTVSMRIRFICITSAAAWNLRKKERKNPGYSLASWNVLIELASDLLPETSDRAAEVLHYLSCRSLDESFSFIPDIALGGTGIHLFWKGSLCVGVGKNKKRTEKPGQPL